MRYSSTPGRPPGRHTSTAGRYPSTVGERADRRMQNLLLDRSFQLKYVGLTMVLSVLASAALGFFLLDQMRENSRILLLDADPIFQEQIAQSDARVTLILIGILAVFNVVLGIGAMFVTHRMAGPLFVFRRYLRMLGEGKIPAIRNLRPGDEFRTLLEQLRDTIDAVANWTQADIEQLERVLKALKDAPDPNITEACSELERILEQKRAMLDPQHKNQRRLDDVGSAA